MGWSYAALAMGRLTSTLRPALVVARRSFRFFFAVVVALLAVVCTRSARAYAPYCDDTASSEDAAPPMLPAADIRFEPDRDVFVWVWSKGYLGDAVVVETRTHTSSPGWSSLDFGAPIELCLASSWDAIVAAAPARRVASDLQRRRGPSGHAPSVYRPPR